MGWFRRRADVEIRESAPFTDAITQSLLAQAEGSRSGDPSALAALETCAGLYARCFANAVVSGTSAVTPRVRAMIARDLIRRGESVHRIDVDAGAVTLCPVGSWDVRGEPDEATWWYRVDTFGPSGNLTDFLPGSAVVHCRYSYDPARSWFGISPLGWARSGAALAANTETRLAEEAGAPVAGVLPVPADGGDGTDDDPLKQLKADIAAAKGRTVLVETTAAGWDEGRASAPQADWKRNRIGGDPPESMVSLRTDAALAVLSACGVPVSLATDADGTSQRESFRRFLTASVQPLAELVCEELTAKLETPVSMNFDALYAHDLAGRASAFKALTAGGMAVAEAAATSGLLADDE
ncbi:MAG: phage portal protein [Acidimicrobiaceae bacterium]|nr:phage portal protein [Acidimicrobiaceae bacterium]